MSLITLPQYNQSLTTGPLTVELDSRRMVAKLNKAIKIKQTVMPQVFQKFKDLTPVANQKGKRLGGNAKNNTTIDNNYVIHADYQYAQVLDQGRGYRDGQMRGSDQAPRGMSEPSKEYAKQLIKAYVNTFGKSNVQI